MPSHSTQRARSASVPGGTHLGEPEHAPERDLGVGAAARDLEGDVVDHQRPRFSASIFFCAGERRASGSSPVSR